MAVFDVKLPLALFLWLPLTTKLTLTLFCFVSLTLGAQTALGFLFVAALKSERLMTAGQPDRSNPNVKTFELKVFQLSKLKIKGFNILR